MFDAGHCDSENVKTSLLFIAEIEKGNWIYIWVPRRLQSSPNDIENGADMNTYTTTSSKNNNANDTKLGRMARTFLAEVCRALEVVGAAYQKGALPRL